MNPYYWSKYWYEVEGDRRSALEEFNLYLEKEIGKKGFHSFDEKIFINTSSQSRYGRFQSAIDRLMYYPSVMGSSDYLSASYGEVFEAVWKAFRSNDLLTSLFVKDFNKPSLQQLYLDPVPEEEYGDSESPKIIAKALEESAKAGLFCSSTELFIPFGIPVIDMENVESIESGQWRGLKEWFQTELPKIEVKKELRQTEALWETQLNLHPMIVIERGVHFLFGDFFAKKNQLVLKSKSIFHTQGFDQIFQKALMAILDYEDSYIESIPYYAGYGGLSHPELWVEGLADALNSPSLIENFFDNWAR